MSNPHERHIGPVLAELAKIAATRPTSFIQPGARRTVAGREFVAVEVQPYKRSDGRDSQLVVWRGHCATCGESYATKGSRNATGLPLNCSEHRGRRTRHGKRRRGLRLAIERAIAAIDAGDFAKARALLAAQVEGPIGQHD